MGTITTLVAERKLIRVTMQLGRGQDHERKLYTYPDCAAWMRDAVPKMVTGRCKSPMTPKEQLRQLFRQWMAGEAMAYDRRFRDLLPLDNFVSEMKTDDLRIFGWIYRPREFIAVCGGYADDYKEPTKTKFYNDDMREVLARREVIDLDGDKYATGPFDGRV